MDDLRQLATLLAKPEPSGDVIDRGRRQLTEAIHAPGGRRPARRRRAGWLTVGLGLAAAATATAVVLSQTAPTSTRGHGPAAPRHPAPAAQVSGRQVLLAAATSALKQHPGTYWHFKIRITMKGPPPPPGVHVIDAYESWIARDGKFWNAQPRCAAPPGTAVFEGPGYAGYALGQRYLTFRQTRRLPTGPAALTAWFARYNQHDSYGASFVPDALAALLWQVPAPPAVRAAAFRALAALPGVRSLGPVKGGVGLLITFPHDPADGWLKLVVDPATSLVRSVANVKSTTLIQQANWTNRLPRIIPLPPATACGS